MLNLHIFNVSFPVFCLNVLKFCFRLADASFALIFCEDWLLLRLIPAKSRFQKFRFKITFVNSVSRGKRKENTSDVFYERPTTLTNILITNTK